MKRCELCEAEARIFCASDQANLCWDCDYKVHATNFLVARHSRTLLCQSCHEQTRWAASGPKLGPTVSLCIGCSSGGAVLGSVERENRNGDEIDLDGDGREESGSSEDDDESEEDEVDNQVVPWSSGYVFDESESIKRSHEVSSDLGFQGNLSRQIFRREVNPALCPDSPPR